MVSVDPLGGKKYFRQVWYSDGSKVLLLPNDSDFKLGYIFRSQIDLCLNDNNLHINDKVAICNVRALRAF